MEHAQTSTQGSHSSLEAAVKTLTLADPDPRASIPRMQHPDRMIRLLKLPKQVSPDGTIELEMKAYSLSDPLTYNALSYTWGCPVTAADEVAAWNAQRETTEVICNGAKVPVGRSLLESLRSIINANFDGDLLWVDALCIDQQNEAEKLVQIQLMGDIYSLATMVIVWLGPSNDKVAMLNEFYNKFSDIVLTQGTKPRTTRLESFTRVLQDAPIQQQQQLLNELSRLLRMSWWTRKWTFQELLLARFPNIMCGGFVYHMNVLRLLLTICSKLQRPEDETIARFAALLQRLTAHERMKLAAELPKPGRSTEQLSKRLNSFHGCVSATAILLDMLIMTAASYATVPPDNILSVLGITKVLAQRLQIEQDFDFMTDQSRQRNLALVLTKKFILELPFLDVLAFAGFGDVELGRPSWEMVLRPSGHLGIFSNQRYNAGILDASKGESYISCRSFDQFNPSTKETPPLQRLQLQGIKVGTINHTQHLLASLPAGYQETSVHDKFHVLTSMLKFCHHIPPTYRHDHYPPGSTELSHSLFRTLFFGSPTGTRPAVHHWAIKACISHFLNVGGTADRARVAQEVSEFRALTGTPAQLAAIFGTDVLGEYRAIMQLFATDPPAAARRWLTLTKPRPSSDLGNGFDQTLFVLGEERIGITARGCRVGDEVWVLQGAEWPYVLRKMEGLEGYQLVGQAYVDGAMDGGFVLRRGEEPGWGPVWIV